jgi:hypothetical protein
MSRHPPPPAATAVLVHISVWGGGRRTWDSCAEALHLPSCRASGRAAMYQGRIKGLYSGEGAVNVM